MEIDLQSYQNRRENISLIVKSVNSNSATQVTMMLLDSINDLYIKMVPKGIKYYIILNHSEVSLSEITFFVPSKEKRINSSDWNEKFY